MLSPATQHRPILSGVTWRHLSNGSASPTWILGCAGAIAAALLPYRRSTAYVGANFITASSSMMGLWRPVWNSTSLCQTTDHVWTCSYCGASWCPPAWPRSDSEGYKE
ncbi:uncharacterized protein cldn14a [Takifugu rubripes]|uniref:uncharacterized protein cldn14a n=1 Tax=Takifugu rubripes TaxID=31033 RepID=UPI0011455426|nr:uncharacterized protein cldn14a [Takifugu rubripes]